jgi:hypothetical protein
MLDAPHAPTIRSSAVTFAGIGEKQGTIYRGKMAEQTRMAGISTIGMVSQLALEIDKPEVSIYFQKSKRKLIDHFILLTRLTR